MEKYYLQRTIELIPDESVPLSCYGNHPLEVNLEGEEEHLGAREALVVEVGAEQAVLVGQLEEAWELHFLPTKQSK